MRETKAAALHAATINLWSAPAAFQRNELTWWRTEQLKAEHAGSETAWGDDLQQVVTTGNRNPEQDGLDPACNFSATVQGTGSWM